MDDRYADGNALAGPLREIFAVELTSATGRCASCGRTDTVAALRVYLDAPGAVARCPGCYADPTAPGSTCAAWCAWRSVCPQWMDSPQPRPGRSCRTPSTERSTRSL